MRSEARAAEGGRQIQRDAAFTTPCSRRSGEYPLGESHEACGIAFHKTEGHHRSCTSQQVPMDLAQRLEHQPWSWRAPVRFRQSQPNGKTRPASRDKWPNSAALTGNAECRRPPRMSMLGSEPHGVPGGTSRPGRVDGRQRSDRARRDRRLATPSTKAVMLSDSGATSVGPGGHDGNAGPETPRYAAQRRESGRV